LKAEFERLKEIANDYFGGFSGLCKKIDKPRSFFYKYQSEISIGRKVLSDLENIGINPEYISNGQTPMFLNTFNLDIKAKEKYLKLGMKEKDYINNANEIPSTNEPQSDYGDVKRVDPKELAKTMEFLTSMPLYKQLAYANTSTIIPDINQFQVGEVIEQTSMRVRNPLDFGAIDVSGNSMKEFNIADGSRVIFNKALQPKNGSIVVVIIFGNLMVKQLIIKNGKYEFHSGDGTTKPITECMDDDCLIIGVVTDVHYKFI